MAPHPPRILSTLSLSLARASVVTMRLCERQKKTTGDCTTGHVLAPPPPLPPPPPPHNNKRAMCICPRRMQAEDPLSQRRFGLSPQHQSRPNPVKQISIIISDLAISIQSIVYILLVILATTNQIPNHTYTARNPNCIHTYMHTVPNSMILHQGS